MAPQGNFRHTETHSSVSREELMMVLAGLELLHIRALFSKISSAASLRKVVLEVAGPGGGGPPASNVELCMCPANYLGDSCQVRQQGRVPVCPPSHLSSHQPPLLPSFPTSVHVSHRGVTLPAALPSRFRPIQPLAHLSANPWSPSLSVRPFIHSLPSPTPRPPVHPDAIHLTTALIPSPAVCLCAL